MSPFLFLSDILDFVIFQGFLVCVHYMLETVRLFTLLKSVNTKRLLFPAVAITCSPSADSIYYATSSRRNSALRKRHRSTSAMQQIRNVD